MTTSRFVRWKNMNPEAYQRLLERRKKRYAEDEAFREKRREAVRKSVQKRKKTRGKKPLKPRLFPHPFTGEMIEFWSVGRVADHWGIAKRTIADLEAKGSIPVNRHVTSTGRRWWPVAYVKWLKPFFDLRTSREISAKEFSLRVWKEWPGAVASGQVPNLSEDTRDQEGRREDHRGGGEGPRPQDNDL